MRQQVRKLRHWKQRWNRNADFVWCRPTTYAGELYQPGDPLPDDLVAKPTKLRRFWESRRIELAEFDAPNVATGQVEEVELPDELPEGVTVVRGRGSWFMVTTVDGTTNVNGRKALGQLLDELRVEVDEADDTDLIGGPGAETEDNPVLVGSDMLMPAYEIEGETVTLDEIVVLTFEDTGLSVEEWNGMDYKDRDVLLTRSLVWMADQGVIEPEPDDDAEAAKGQSERGEDEVSESEAQTDDAPEAETTETADDDGWLDGEEA